MKEIMISDIQKDALKELANIGAGHTSTALSQMIKKDIIMAVPDVNLVPIEKVADLIKDEPAVVGIFLKIYDELPSYVLLLLPLESAFSLADMAIGRRPDTIRKILSDMDKSALQELSNVMICSFFNSVAKFLNISVTPSVPYITYDMPVAIMDYVLIQVGELAENIMFFNVILQEEKEKNLRINMFLIPEPKSIEIILEKLGVE